MSEFVECQNCGRTFFAENLDCPYCGGEDEDDDADMVADLMRTVAPSTKMPVPRSRTGLFTVLFAGFVVVAALFCAWSVALLVRTSQPAARAGLAAEAVFAAVAAWSVLARRSWARSAAVGFIVCNTVLGLASLVATGLRPFLAWGPASAMLLLFAPPFFSPQARERFRR